MTTPLTFSRADDDHHRACDAALKQRLPLHLRMVWPAVLALAVLTFLTATILSPLRARIGAAA